MGLYELDGIGVTTPADGRFWVAPNAVVAGKVTLGDDVSIWFNTVIRGDNDPIHIGDRSNIQDACLLHTDLGFPMTIGPDCTIGHMVMLHGCRIGRCSLIGIGAIVLNGADIGEECMIGAHTLIPEGKVIPPRSVVLGVPGKIVRQINEEDLIRIKAGIDIYRENWRRYAASLRPQTV
ncbi:MAG: gamma carbonic anhydrase family protein [Candidatus Limnocylindria bacterium]